MQDDEERKKAEQHAREAADAAAAAKAAADAAKAAEEAAKAEAEAEGKVANAEALTEEEIAKQVADEMQAAADARAEETKQNLVVPTPPRKIACSRWRWNAARRALDLMSTTTARAPRLATWHPTALRGRTGRLKWAT